MSNVIPAPLRRAAAHRARPASSSGRRVLGVCGLATLLALACDRQADTPVEEAAVQPVAPARPAAAAPLSTNAAVAAALAGEADGPLVVRVVSHQDASSYTWLQVHGARPDDGAAAVRGWVAGPALSVADGALVRVARYTRMVDFESRALGRRFDVALFANEVVPVVGGAPQPASAVAAPAATGVVPEALAAMPAKRPAAPAGALQPGEETLPAGHPPISGQPHGVGAQVDGARPRELPSLPERFATIEVPVADATIAAVHQGRQERRDQALAVRGVVVRVVSGVLGKNWLRIADGTGEGKTAVLLVATTDEVPTGAQVLVRGVLRVDHEVGQGLRYATLLEATEITREGGESL